ncbi:MAG: starch-binding protein [Muribaculaceae bacterium]|nr:starch-binding protein [Muribaculaceae bacterium]
MFTISNYGPCKVIVSENGSNQTADLGPYSADRYIVYDPSGNNNNDRVTYNEATPKPQVTEANVYVYDPSASTVTIGGQATTEVTGTYCKWKKATVTGSSDPFSVTISGSTTLSVSLANNATKYYYFNGTTYVETTASYNPNAGNSYTIYVATENMSTAPYLYAWDDFGTPLGSWAGQEGSTTQVINGYTWYKFTISDRGPCKVIVSENNGSNQTADLGPYSADRYIVYDPTDNSKVTYNEAVPKAEAAVDVYIIGYNGDWTTGTKLLDSNSDNTTYSLTGVRILADSFFRIRTSAGDQFGPATDQTPVTSGTAVTMTATNSNAYKVTASGLYTVEVDRTNRTAPTVKLTKTAELPLYIIGSDNAFGAWTLGNALAMTTSDGNTYTASNVTLSGTTNFIFSNVNDDWSNVNDGNRFCPSTEDQVTTVYPGIAVTTQATSLGNATYQIAAGSYDITFNRTTLQFTFTPHGASVNQYVIHVIDQSYNARTPYLYAWDSYDQKLNGDFPGNQLTTTETINGETWYKITLSTYSSTISANASAIYDNTTHQTADITNIAPGDYYIVFNSDSESNITPSHSSATTPATAVRTQPLYLMHNHSGSWNINTGDAFTVSVANNTYTGTLTGINLKRDGDYFFFGKKLASAADAWSELEGFRFGPSTNDDAAWPGDERTAHNNSNSYTIGKTGTYSFSYNLATNAWTPTLTAANSDSKMYVVISDGVDNFAWNRPIEMTRNGNTFSYTGLMVAGDYFIFTVATGNDWNSSIRYTCNGDADEVVATSTNYTAVRNGTKAYKVETSGTWTLTYNYLTDQWSATRVDINTNTGELYVVGMVNSQKWDAHTGLAMTKSASGNVFTIDRVQIVEGASFCFTTKLGENAGDWSHIKPFRVYPVSDGNFVVTDAFVNNATDVEKTSISLQGYGREVNFMMTASGTYNITVDLDQMKVTFTRPFQSVYMIGNVNKHQVGANNEWNATQGSEMRSNDGENYLLNVSLNAGETFSFSKVIAEDNNQGGWDYVNANRYYTEGGDEFWVTSEMVNTTITNVDAYSSFLMKVSGNYIVTFNPTENTLFLKETYTPVAMVKVYLEQTPNVTDPRLTAFDKLRDSNGNLSNIEWPNPDTDDVQIIHNIQQLAPNAQDATTSDGRTWWVWDVPNSIADVVFYRSGGIVKNNDTQWRIAGEHYYTWEVINADESAFNEHTREYFHASASGVADCANMWEGHYYVYYTNTASWNDVHVHYWYDSAAHSQGYEDSVYPGPKATLVGYDDQGFEVWLYDFGLIEDNTSTPIGILFNNGDNNDATKQQTGNFDYSNGACYDFLGSVYLGQSLANIIANGEEGPRYTIEDELVAVYYNDSEITEIEIDGVKHNVQGALYVKDNENYLNKSLNKDGKIDYIKDRHTHLMGDLARYDQSNWVKIVKSPGTLENVELAYYVGKAIPANSMKGKIVNKQNPEIHIDAIGDNSTTRTYSPNVYITCHFNDDYVINNNGDYFFVKPKPQEYAHIIWAVYDRNEEDPDDPGRFYVPASNNISDNAYNLEGGFRVDWSNYDGNWKNNFRPGNVYEFDAIIRYVTPSSNVGGNSSGAPRRTQHKDFDPSNSQFMVYPLSNNYHDDTLTGVTNTVSKKTVVGVTYYNLMGVESREPFSGVNIVVTRYSDGSTTSRKVLK